MMNNVIICMLNSQYIHSSLAPWCLLSGIKEYGSADIHAKVIESNINTDIKKLACDIISDTPAIVGFCCYIWNIDKVKELCRNIKDRIPGCVTVLGGPEVSYNAKEILSENAFVDFILSGEGERTFPMLCDTVISGNTPTPDSIPGLCMRKKGEICVSEPFIENSQPPSPYTEEYLDALNGKICYIESSRGCPFSCAFCLSGRCGSVRFFDLEQTKQEILKLSNTGTKTVKFIDRTFNANRKRAIEIWKFIAGEYGKKIPSTVCFHFEIGGDLLSDECLDAISKMPKGSIQLEIGIQSFNEKTLDAINRKTDLAHLCTNIKKLTSFGNMHTHIDLIAGLPFEDYNSFKESFNKAFSLGANMLQLGFLKLLHGSEMRDKKEKYPCEYNTTAPYEVISTPWLGYSEIEKLKLIDAVNDKISNSGRFIYSLEYILSNIPLTPFDTFEKFGEYIKDYIKSPMPFFDLAERYYSFFSSFSEIDKDILFDKMICDFFSHSRYGKLPVFLKRKDARVKKILEFLSKNPTTKKPENAVRAVAVLDSLDTIVYCDSGICKQDDTYFKSGGHYRLNFIKKEDVEF
ncbi:MAG: DUF4080 domain-containing protein [Clostridia bacterium]|nr:DUF4080 domain-containing protein [Clostridia bacterium]